MAESHNHADSDAIVAVHTRAESPDKLLPNQAAGGATIEHLTELGVMTLFVPAGETDAYELTAEGLFVKRGYVTTSSKGVATVGPRHPETQVGVNGGVTAVRARTLKLLPSGIDELTPVVNGPRATALDNKVRQRQLFAEHMAVGVTIEPGAEIGDIAMLPNDIWLKAANGLAGKGSYRATKDEVTALLASVRAERASQSKSDPGWVIEEHDPGRPVRELRSLVPDMQRFIDYAPSAVNHEVRIHCFAHKVRGGVAVDLAPVFRFCAGDSTWIPADPQSLPVELRQMAVEAAHEVLKQTGYQGLQVAVDAYLSGKTGSYRMRELNVRDPAMGSWITKDNKRLTVAERVIAGEVANWEHGKRMAVLLAQLAKSPYNNQKG